MGKTGLFSLELFRDFQDKEQFFGKLTSDGDIGKRILSQYLLLVVFSAGYGIVMGCYNGAEQAISSGVKVPAFLTLTLLVCFPVFYITDLLQNVEALVGLGYGDDPRLANALTLILDKQDDHGRWALEYHYTGKTWVDFGEAKQPNRWVTLRALRALNYWEANQGTYDLK